jgi:transaldolase
MLTSALQLLDLGQSLWLDYVDRALLASGRLRQMVELGLRGVTSNPTIFHRAITGGGDYDDTIRELLSADPALETSTLCEWLMIQDVQMAADVLQPVYETSKGVDGFVSLEVSPRLAYDADGTIAQARHLWKAVHRPNLMIKVPATREGLIAIEALTAEGINVNVTLLFGIARYDVVITAFLNGLAHNAEAQGITSVASFFVSRIDTKVDARLDELGSSDALALRGRIAIANAKLAYGLFRERIEEEPYSAQRRRGARLQRLLWGSTSTKNPDYPDLLYVDSLIGRDTVNTVPLDTFDAFFDHGTVRETLTEGLDKASRDLEQLGAVGIDLDEVTGELEKEGIEKFAESYDLLLQALDEKRETLRQRRSGGA